MSYMSDIKRQYSSDFLHKCIRNKINIFKAINGALYDKLCFLKKNNVLKINFGHFKEF